MIKKTVFLIGGTGNQLFQVSKYGEEAAYSSFFLKKIVCKIFKFSHHEQFLQVPNTSLFMKFILTSLLFADLIIFKLLGFSLFTKMNINLGKSSPIIKEILILDYAVGENLPKNVNNIKRMLFHFEGFDCLIHIRGGDLLSNGPALEKYGKLGADYYINAINHLNAIDRGIKSFTVTTDDIEYSKNVLSKISENFEFNYINVPVGETISRAINSKYFISSNSTLSYWMVALRESKYSIVPNPFWKSKNFNFNSNIKKINFLYD